MSKVSKKNCFSCGLCGNVCPNGALQLSYSEATGVYYPCINEKICVDCGMCEKICIKTDYCKKKINRDNIIGDYKKICLMSATNLDVRKAATSGGVLNRFVKYLIQADVVQAVLMVCQVHRTKTDTGYTVITKQNVGMLDKNPRKFSSRYCLVPLLVGLKKIESYNSVAVVGTPCQLFGVTKWEHLKNKKIIKIGIACSQGISYKATEYMLRKRGADCNELFYRGNGWPGKSTIISKMKTDNQEHLSSLFNVCYTSQLFRNEACNACSDQLNRCSDISFFDYWNEEELRREHIGKSGVIIRSSETERYIMKMEEEGEIICNKILNEYEVIQSQSWAIKFKVDEKSLLMRLYLKFVRFERKIGIYKLFGKKFFGLHIKLFDYLLK